MGCLYIIDGPKKYVGITLQKLEDRWEQHILASRRTHPRSYLHRALKKYGTAAFSIKPLVVANDWNYLCALEKRVIAAFGTIAPIGYNATSGGDGVIGLDPETKAVHRERTSLGTKKAWRENPDLREKRRIAQARPEAKEKAAKTTRERNLRLYATPGYREKILAARRNPVTRAQISEAVKRLWRDPDYRARMMLARRNRIRRHKENNK